MCIRDRYITAQQTVAFDEVTKKQIQNPPVKTVQWYKVTQTCTPLEYDIDRGDYAYEIKYLISRYQINTPRSPYFPPAMYRGVHKLYNYWFTGENTEVINFEIDVNSNYLQYNSSSGEITYTNDLALDGVLTGSVFGDDSSLLVDGINNRLVMAVSYTHLTLPTNREV